MKRIAWVRGIGFVLLIIYIALIITDLWLGVLGDNSVLVFSILMALISINLIHKGILLKSQSTLWFAISLMLFAIAIIVCRLCGVEPIEYYFVFALIPIISSIINVAIFSNMFYIKIIILNISIIIPILILYFSSLSWIYIALIGAISVGVGILICRNLSFDKEKI